MTTLNKFNLSNSPSDTIYDLRNISSIGEITLSNASAKFLHLKCNIPPTLSELPIDAENEKSVGYHIFVPDASLSSYIGATNWSSLFNSDEYISIRNAYETSLARHQSGLYDGNFDQFNNTNLQNRLWPESMMYWMGFGKLSYTGDLSYSIEPEDYLTAQELEYIFLDCPEPDKIVLERKQPTNINQTQIYNDNHILDVFFNENLSFNQNKMYRWVLYELPEFPANLFQNDKLLTDGTVFKNCAMSTSIGDNAFYGCTNMTKFGSPQGVNTYGNFVFYGDRLLNSVNLVTNSTLGVATLGYTGLNSVLCDDININECSFIGCYDMKTLFIIGSKTSIADLAFKDCVNLESVIIPDSIVSIGSGAFFNTKSLNTIIIGTGITNINAHAFSDEIQVCPRSIIMKGTTPPTIDNTSFANSYYGTLYDMSDIYVDNNALSDYTTAWPKLADRIQGVTVGDYSNTSTPSGDNKIQYMNCGSSNPTFLMWGLGDASAVKVNNNCPWSSSNIVNFNVQDTMNLDPKTIAKESINTIYLFSSQENEYFNVLNDIIEILK